MKKLELKKLAQTTEVANGIPAKVRSVNKVADQKVFATIVETDLMLKTVVSWKFNDYDKAQLMKSIEVGAKKLSC